MCTEFKDNEILTVDLHGYDVQGAKKLLEKTVVSAPGYVKEIIVVHGSNNGDAIKKMVRSTFKCRRVARKFISLNDGITSLILK